MNPQEIFERFERRKLWRRFAAILFIFLYLFYLSWRVTILNEESFTLSVVYLCAEILGFILGINTIFKSWDYSLRQIVKAEKGLKIDVIIPTYHEPLDIIRKTLIAAKDIEYPHHTILLDDGRREEVKQLADEIGVGYFSREVNSDAKAGNLNFGLKYSDADFLMVFDADHIALPHAIDDMLGYFRDEAIAMVQAPQHFYNIDSFQYINAKKNRGLWHDQSFYYNIGQPCLDKNDLASCLGTGVIFRRSAIDKIGGIPTQSLTEDTHTSFLLNKMGYKTIYHNHIIAYGVAASDLSEFYKTRRRWAFGNIQVIRKEKTLSCKGLSFRHRLYHLSHCVDHLEGWQQLLLLNVPIFSLIFGLAPFEISVFNVLITFTFPFIIYALLQEIGCGFSRLWTNEIFSMLRWPIYLSVLKAWLNQKMAWSSSSKNMKGKINWSFMYPQLMILALSVFSLMVAFVKLQKVDFKVGPIFLFFQDKILNILDASYVSQAGIGVHSIMKAGYTFDLVMVSGMWVIYNMYRILYLVRKVVKDSDNSHEFYRFKTVMPMQIGDDQVKSSVGKISQNWIQFTHNHNANMQVGDVKDITLFLATQALKLKASITHMKDTICEADLIFESQQDCDMLCKAIYHSDAEGEFVNQTSYFFILSDAVLGLFKKKKKHATLQLQSLIYGENRPAIINETLDEEGKNTITLFDQMKVGDVLRAVKSHDTATIALKITDELQGIKRGFDGSTLRKYKVISL